MEISVLGDAFIDVLAHDTPAMPQWGGDVRCSAVSFEAGGSALNTAVHLKSLAPQHTVTLFTCMGDGDVGSNLLTAHLAHHKVNVNTTRRPEQTGTCIVLSGSADRGFVSALGASGAWELEQVPVAAVARGRHLHLSGVFNLVALQPVLTELVQRIRVANKAITVSMDTNYDPTGDWGRQGQWLERLIAQCDVVKVNEAEARAISGESDAKRALAWLSHRARMLGVVTLGERGAMASLHGDPTRIVTVSARKTSVLDPTGAGDAFNAGFIAAFLRDGDVESALRYAVACGSANVTRRGACKVPVAHDDIAHMVVDDALDDDESMGTCVIA